jgi:hypothetical protein
VNSPENWLNRPGTQLISSFLEEMHNRRLMRSVAVTVAA